MYQDERKLDFKPIGIAIKKAREAKGWTQEYLMHGDILHFFCCYFYQFTKFDCVHMDTP